jgi:protein involved in polysaccharide export with SLBB domain
VPKVRALGWVLILALAPTLAHSQSVRTVDGADSVAPLFGAPNSLAPGDLIAVNIWREPDWSDTVQVDNAGVAVFPRLGPLPVTGIRPDSLEHRLIGEYGRYLQNPSIRVTVLRRITIWGAVVRPGPYPVDLTMTVTDALALAGGPTATGKTDKVELRRGSVHRVIDLSDGPRGLADLSLRSGDQLHVPEKSWASRNIGLVIAAIGTVTSLAFLVARE